MPPPNNNRADAVVIPSLPFYTTVDTTNSTVESGEPDHTGVMERSVWYRLTVDSPQIIYVDSGDDPWPRIAVYVDGGSFAIATEQELNEDPWTNFLRFTAWPGYLYEIQIGGTWSSFSYGLADLTFLSESELPPGTLRHDTVHSGDRFNIGVGGGDVIQSIPVPPTAKAGEYLAVMAVTENNDSASLPTIEWESGVEVEFIDGNNHNGVIEGKIWGKVLAASDLGGSVTLRFSHNTGEGTLTYQIRSVSFEIPGDKVDVSQSFHIVSQSQVPVTVSTTPATGGSLEVMLWSKAVWIGFNQVAVDVEPSQATLLFDKPDGDVGARVSAAGGLAVLDNPGGTSNLSLTGGEEWEIEHYLWVWRMSFGEAAKMITPLRLVQRDDVMPA